MKIKRLEVGRFGKIENKSFEISPGLTLFIGNNGAGKTTLMEFIHQILFEFPKKNQKEINYKIHQGKEIGGQLIVETDDGKEATIRRQSGPGSRVGQLEISVGNEPIKSPNEKLSEWLHHLNQKELRQLFTFNLENLQALKDLPKEDLNEYFQSITTEGTQKVYQQLNQLQKDAEALYKKAGQNPLLNQKFIEYEKIKEYTEEVAQKNEKIIKLKQEEKILLDEHEKVQNEFKKLSLSAEKIKSLLIDAEQAGKISTLITKKYKDLPEELNRQTYQQWQEQLNSVIQLKKIRQELEEEIVQEDIETSEIVKEYKKNYKNWDNYLKNHFKAVHLAEEIDRLNEKIRILKEQFEFFAPKTYLFQSSSIQEIALPDSLTEIQLKKYFQLIDQQEEKEKELSVHSEKKEELIKQQTNHTTHHLLKIVEENQSTSYQNQNLNGKHLFQYGVWLISLISLIIYLLSLHKNPVLLVISLIFAGMGLAGTLKTNRSNKNHGSLDDFRLEAIRLEQELRNVEQTIEVLNQETMEIKSKQHKILKEAGWIVEQYTEEELTKQNERYKKLQQFQYQIFSKENEKKEKITELKNLQLPLRKLKDEWEFISDPLKRQLKINNFLVALQNNKEANQEKGKKQLDLKWRLKKVERELEQAQEYLKDEFGKLGENSEQVKENFSKYLKNEQLDFQISHLKSQLSRPYDQVPVFDSLLEIQAKNTNDKEKNKERLEKIQRELSDKRSEIKYLLESGDYEEALQEQANFEEEIGLLADEWISLQMGRYLLKTTLTKNMETVFNNIQKNINKYFNFLTENFYHQINWDGNYIILEDQLGEYYQLEQLSSGTSEQLYLAIRLAFVEEISQHFSFPLIIDDAFVNFDKNRRVRAYELLDEFSKKQQVIYFTFNTDVVDYLKEAKMHTLNG